MDADQTIKTRLKSTLKSSLRVSRGILKCVGVKDDDVIAFTSSKYSQKLPCPSKVSGRDLFRKFVRPQRKFLQSVIKKLSSVLLRERLVQS